MSDQRDGVPALPVIVGSVLGCIVLLSVLLCILVCVKKRECLLNKRESLKSSKHTSESPVLKVLYTATPDVHI